MKKISIAKSVGSAVAVVGAVVAPYAAMAGTALENLRASAETTATSAGVKGQGTGDLTKLVGNFISAALGLLGVILVVIIIYAGFLWMTAQGNDEKVKQAKKMISNAVVGMILIFASYAITQFVINALDASIKAA